MIFQDKRREKTIFSLERVVTGMLPKGMSTKDKTTDIQQILLFATTAEQVFISSHIILITLIH